MDLIRVFRLIAPEFDYSDYPDVQKCLDLTARKVKNPGITLHNKPN